MTQQELNELMEGKIFDELRRLRGAGQAEYAGRSQEAFGNFERLESELGVSREKILWVYAMKHKDGIASFLNGHTSQREDVRGRIADLMVYMCLLWAMIEEAEDRRRHVAPKATGWAEFPG
jgi:hypothetical protein